MKLKRLYIGDMGIYRNALMENIGPKLVVIGGLNRSGKTTLMEILRHMPYGFPKDIREARTEYFVEADLSDEEDKIYTMKLSGLREPQISCGSEQDYISKPLYGTVDKYTYSQLYTISLEELKRANVKSEEEKLQSVLLGAGLKDIVHIPKLADEFRKEKEKLGGKQGNPTTKAFKPYYDKLLGAMEEREEALKQLEAYEAKCRQIAELEKDLEACSCNVDSMTHKVNLLELLKTYYKQLQEKESLELQLEELQISSAMEFSDGFPSLERIEALYEEYKDYVKQYEKLKQEFESSVSFDEVYYQSLIRHKEEIKDFEKRLSGLQQKVENYRATKQSFDMERQQLHSRMNILNSSLKEDFIKVLNIDCDSIDQDKLLSLVEKHNSSEAEKKQLEREFEGLRFQREALQKEAKTDGTEGSSGVIGKYLYISIAAVMAGVLLTFLSRPLGGAVALAGVVAASLYFILKNLNQPHQSVKAGNLNQLNIIESRIKALEQNLEVVSTDLKESKNLLDSYSRKLELYRDVSPMGLLQYFKDIRELKKDILKLGNSGTILEKVKQEISSDLAKADILLSLFDVEHSFREKELVNSSVEIFLKLEKLNEQLIQAEKLSQAEALLGLAENKLSTLLNQAGSIVLLEELDNIIDQYKIYNHRKEVKLKIENIQRQIVNVLQSEKIKKAFEVISEEYNVRETNELEAFIKLFQSFNSEEQLIRELQETNMNLLEDSRKLEELKEVKQNLGSEIKALRTSEKLVASQREIDEQRGALKQLAVKYSVYSAAEFILESVQKNFIETAKDTILGGAGNIFNKITGGEYKALLPGENLLQTDFKAMLQDGQVQDSVAMLSRGTGEQLYLSVRLNRIKDIKEKLPVILDDPFVNFDGLHIRNTLKVLSDTAETNQVFILTCHTELVKLVSEISSQVQYWKLQKGNFELSSSEELIDYLF